MKVGDKVRVNVPASDGSFPITGKFNGRVFTVSRRKLLRNSAYYELKGLNSKEGIPYSFCNIHLELLKNSTTGDSDENEQSGKVDKES